MADTDKHNMRIPKSLWDPAKAKADRLAAAGYLGEHERFSLTDAVRAALRVFLAESDTETIQRLELESMLAEVGEQ